MLRYAFDRTGYSQEEAYFHQENKRLLAKLKEALNNKLKAQQESKKESEATKLAKQNNNKAA